MQLPVPFSFLTARSTGRRSPSAVCTPYDDSVHDLVRPNIGVSPLYNGQIQRHRTRDIARRSKTR